MAATPSAHDELLRDESRKDPKHTAHSAAAAAASPGSPSGGDSSPIRMTSRMAKATAEQAAAMAEHKERARERGFAITHEELDVIALNRDPVDLERHGGMEDVARKLKTNLERGLTDEQVAESRYVFGENRMPEKRMKNFFEHLFESLQDLTLIILMIASTLTIIFGEVVSERSEDTIQGIAIFVAVAVVSLVTSTTNYVQDREFHSLSQVKENRNVQVLRNGIETSVSIFEVVVGDVFVMKAGEVLPCDGIFIRGNGVTTNESAMTGESKQIHKTRESPFMVGGSTMDAGAGYMLVTTVGENTSYGKIVKNLQSQESPETPLQVKLDRLATYIGKLGLLVGFLTFVVLIIAWGVTKDDKSDAVLDILSFVILAITITVVAVPEGLPLAVTIALAFSMRRMTLDQNLVRELSACETMGSATCICSDKTGTLTTNRMTVVKGWFFGREFPDIPKVDVIGGEAGLHTLATVIARNSDANIEYFSDGRPPLFKDNKTECALLHMLHSDYGVDFEQIRRDAGFPYFRENFTSARKRMTSIYTDFTPADGSAAGYHVYVKGASEMVLSLCTNFRGPDGNNQPITPEFRDNINSVIDALASQGLRTLAVGYRRLPRSEEPCSPEAPQSERDHAFLMALDDIEKDITLVAILGIKDPVRKEVPGAVDKCRNAGIRVRMVTGDNLKTAMHIARECRILEGDNTEGCIEGRAFREMTPDQRVTIIPKLRVLARSTPDDKLLLVNHLKLDFNEIVAVTGDGTNDAPALKAAHVGLSMGIAGTEVAKEASKIVILDDNFASIVQSVKWGRNVTENIRRFLTFQLTINIVSCTVTFIIACTKEGSTQGFPITPVQLLWINLIMDSFAALALATEPPSDALLLQQPQGMDVPLITKNMNKYLIGHSIFQIALVLFLTLTQAGADIFEAERESIEHNTSIFNTFVFLQMFNKINVRKIHDELDIMEGFFHAKLALFMIFLIVFFQVLIVEFGGSIASTTHLTWSQWLTCVAIGTTSIPIGYLMRLIPYFDLDDVISARYGYHKERIAAALAENQRKKEAAANAPPSPQHVIELTPMAGGAAAAGGQ